jgi:serine-type D-Ala-D-Ala carboxypeptidase (penicillin-binding protein 5/6)
LLRPVPSMALTASVTTVRALPGAAPGPDWPGRAEAAVGLPGAGLLGAHGGSRPVPIASLAKIMTTDIVLRDRPLPAGGPGPAITVTAADAAAYASDERRGQSVVKVAPGEKLTERQALEAMLILSGNNIASLLARWDAGSERAFVAKMNARARSLGLRSTRYADASGADPATVSTASDQFRLTVRALQVPAFRQIVAMRQVTLPVAGVAYNVSTALGHDGIVGVKTGATSQAGGCLAFAAIRTVAKSQVMIVGVVLGVRATPARPSELGAVISAAENLLGSVGGDLEHVQVVRPGAVLGERVQRADRRARRGRGHRGQRDRLARYPRYRHGEAPPAGARGQPGPARRPGHVTIGSDVHRIILQASRAAPAPPVRWLLTRP